MKSMNIFALFIIVGFISNVVNGHTYWSSMIIGTQTLSEGDCMRPQYSGGGGQIFRNSPINDKSLLTNGLLGPNMTCGFRPYSEGAANRKCSVAAGSQITLQWWHEGNTAGDQIIDGSHKGPVMVYLAKSDTGSGNVWFKIYEDGWSNNNWGSIRMKNNRGKFTVTIPGDISPGNYLMRGEVIALHEGYATKGSQPYVGCAELTITGGGSANPAGVAFPGAYSETDPGIKFDIYNAFTTYPVPGPAVYTAGSNPTVQTTGSSQQGTTTTSSTSSSSTSSSSTSTGASSTNSNSGGNSGSTGNACTDPTVCNSICGEGQVARCLCDNGNSVIECKSSDATTLVASLFFALVLVFLAY